MPNRKELTVSAPGSVMLLGEHSVLRDGPALVSAVNYRMSVKLSPRSDRKIQIYSALGERQYDLDDLKIEAPFQFVLTAIKLNLPILSHGFVLEIASDFSHQVGLGSSAAVTAATISALQKYFLGHFDLHQVWQMGKLAIRAVQGMGSGADMAASVYGGTVYYQQQVGMIERFNSSLPYGLIYSGSKMPTSEVIKIVEEKFKRHPEELFLIDTAISECTRKGLLALRQHNWEELGMAFNMQQQYMEKLGVSHEPLQEIIKKLADYPLYGAKISGSGLGDCVVFLGGAVPKLVKDERYIPIQTSPQGILII